MVKWFEIFKTQKEVEKSIPKINVESCNPTNKNSSFLDNKKVEISYTVLLFCAMMSVVIAIIIYLAGYTHSETEKLQNLFVDSNTRKPSQIKIKNNTAGSNINEEETKVELQKKVKEKFATGSMTTIQDIKINSYLIELYYGRTAPDPNFLKGLKKIVKNVLNIEIDTKYVKKDKIFYIIIYPITSESEGNKVIELLKTKKMISKNNGKIKQIKEDILSNIERKDNKGF